MAMSNIDLGFINAADVRVTVKQRTQQSGAAVAAANNKHGHICTILFLQALFVIIGRQDRFPESFRFRSFKMEFMRRAYMKLSILRLTARVPSLPTIGREQWPPITRIVDAQIQKR